jgi:hypothetical protein
LHPAKTLRGAGTQCGLCFVNHYHASQQVKDTTLVVLG